MSLSFVTSAIQTGTSDGRYEEKPIESKEVDDANRRNEHKPLFEQLRKNQEEDDQKKEDEQREMMRGTRALDEEDVAHLDALDKQRFQRALAIQRRTHDEVALFRAARVERQQYSLIDADNDDGDDDDNENKEVADPHKALVDVTATSKEPTSTVTEPIAPKIIVKKRRRRVVESKEGTSKKPGPQHKKPKQTLSEAPKVETGGPNKEDKGQTNNAGLGSLLCGYGSSDDDSE
jgi:hypothetical protein